MVISQDNQGELKIMATKFYIIDPAAYESAIADRATKGLKPLPLQQRLILQAFMSIGRPATGKEIIDYAVTHLGLQTRQRYDVLYAWYARSNEEYGVSQTNVVSVKPTVTNTEPQSDEIPWSDLSDAKIEPRTKKSKAA
jgi:hypothetical protein